MAKQHSLLVAAAMAALLGCAGSDEKAAQKAVRDALKDPESARFGTFTKVKEDRACLAVNAKNSYGGYTGEQQAFLFKLKGDWYPLRIDKDFSHEKCIELIVQLKD